MTVNYHINCEVCMPNGRGMARGIASGIISVESLERNINTYLGNITRICHQNFAVGCVQH